MKLKDEKDIREINRSVFKAKKFIEQDDLEVVIKTNFKQNGIIILIYVSELILHFVFVILFF